MLDQTPASDTGAHLARADSAERTLAVGNQTILIGDCLRLLSEISEQSIDVVVTSPPYNIGLRYKSYDDAGSRAEYLAWMRAIGVLLKRILKDDGSFFLNVAGTSSDPWIGPDVANVMRDVFALQNSIVWVKSLSIRDETFGHFKPVNSPRYLNH